MTPRPRGKKYRNLTLYRGSVYYQRVVNRKRKFICLKSKGAKVTDWDLAIRLRDALEERLNVEPEDSSPLLRDACRRYLEQGTRHLAPSTARSRKKLLGEKGRLLLALGARRLGEIDGPMVHRWYAKEIAGRGLAHQTGLHYLNSLNCVYKFAIRQGEARRSQNPVPGVREDLAEDRRTKRGRAESRRDRNIRPLEEPSELKALVEAAKAEGIVAEVFVLLLLDAGLRLGEALALAWGKVRWEGNRSLRIDQNLPHGGSGEPEEPKSGRPRNVQLSKRLAEALRRLYEQRFRPSPDERVLAGKDGDNFRHREWRRICERAEIGTRKLKDLRDTYASQLLTCGVQLGYVSVQLGHSSPTVTAEHYAKWCGADYYRAPLNVEPGEVPADLLSRLEGVEGKPLRLACVG